ncbi:MAG: hypothetical protein ABWZ40_12210 [Caulobacterales bacterium]
MSDISLNITWFDLILYSPFFGWPGLILGGLLGAFAWRKRPWLGGAIGAIAGNFIVFYGRFFGNN